MSTDANEPRPRISIQRAALQIVGFLVGIGLIVWCVRSAGQEADWRGLLSASPLDVAGLLAATMLSVVINAGAFWTVLHPIRRHSIWSITLINGIAGLFNYAPVRLGLIARMAYHIRVDRIEAGVVITWMLATALFMMLSLVIVGVATVAAPLGIWTVVLVVGQLVLAKLLLNVAMALPPARALTTRFQSLAPMLLSPMAYWGTMSLRLLDVGAFVLRMWLAARIIGLSIPAIDVVMLALTAQLVSLSPLGRLGFREAAVAFLASRLESGLGTGAVESIHSQLAVVESAGEAAVLVPLGVLAAPWYLWVMRRARRSPPA
jgi:hypothetical protein